MSAPHPASRPGPASGPARPRPAPPPVFLERTSYRRRRLGDAARLLPWAGGAAFMVPLLWPDDGLVLSSAFAYVFGAWAALIALAWAFGAALLRVGPEDARPEAEAAPVQTPDPRT